ncbi:alpha/beta fold hydrolase [Nannocystis sp. bb15-2]|uniref:Alpha/beta fold hydrolase n=1 Tax=Nannocystis bainbridge TaxID=2995303 RepID=A0ABT5E3E0_9BACT|nr:alpha/beta fold hydrolase [Nannocystis bainbridge]MDC0720386.1 alpha/beta fold hydrolase [Nannocystis bainbridge]
MSTFVLIHGAGDVGWYWHLVEAELRARGHDVVAPDLPGDDDSLELEDYADAVVAAVGDRRDLVVVGQSFGGFTAPLVAARLPVDALVFVSGMVPAPGEAPRDWWQNTRYRQAVEEQAARDGGVTGSDDPYVCFYHDVPRELATLAMGKERAHPAKAAMASPWPLDALPEVPTRFVLCTEDRFFPPAFMRRVVAERLGVVPDEIAAGHCVALSRPVELASLLEQAGRRRRPRLRVIDHYDAELRRHNERLRAAAGVRPGDRVLDIGCGGGQSTRDAARAAAPGSAVGIDVSAELLELARRRTADEGVQNATYERGDAQVHVLPPGSFDVVLSRFGTMFFADPLAAFENIARATRPGGRLVMMVWQSRERNEWATAIQEALGARPPPGSLDAFSLADAPAVESLLVAAGFTNIAFAEVREPVYYGPDASAAVELVRDFISTRELLLRMESAAAQRAVGRLRATLAAHQTGEGVLFESCAWIVTARRAP